ncbi:MAG: DUF4870 domain-containing protein [Clostridia bacterium]|nr:DUF4870 domain-containing protein [Clostridia bacterium]
MVTVELLHYKRKISTLIPNIGIIAPIIIWVNQKEKSKFVKFNAIQAIFGSESI